MGNLSIRSRLFFERSDGIRYTADSLGLSVQTISDQCQHLVVDVDTTGTQLTYSKVANMGYLWIRNNSPDNFVLLKTASDGFAFAKLLPGEIAFFRCGSTSFIPYAVADTAPCEIEYLLISN